MHGSQQIVDRPPPARTLLWSTFGCVAASHAAVLSLRLDHDPPYSAFAAESQLRRLVEPRTDLCASPHLG